MAETSSSTADQPPAKRIKFDLTTAFDVLVGKGPLQQRFPVYTNILTQRSEFFRAARSSEWLADPAKPVDLEHEDPEVLSAYLHIVYFGIETIQVGLEKTAPEPQESFHKVKELGTLMFEASIQPALKDKAPSDVCDDKKEDTTDAFELSLKECDKRSADREKEVNPCLTACDAHYLSLAKLYLLADKLHDLTTANLVMDEFVRSSFWMVYNPPDKVVNLVYESSVHGNPLRRLLRDICVYNTSRDSHLDYNDAKLHGDFTRDVIMEFVRRPDDDDDDDDGKDVEDGDEEKEDEGESESGKHVSPIARRLCADRCFYHQHNMESFPRCTPETIISARSCGCCKM